VTGLSFTDTILVSKKVYQITRESEAKLKTQGDAPPDDKAVSKAQLRRDSSNNLIQLDSGKFSAVSASLESLEFLSY
jgi:hypothetical protein